MQTQGNSRTTSTSSTRKQNHLDMFQVQQHLVKHGRKWAGNQPPRYLNQKKMKAGQTLVSYYKELKMSVTQEPMDRWCLFPLLKMTDKKETSTEKGCIYSSLQPCIEKECLEVLLSLSWSIQPLGKAPQPSATSKVINHSSYPLPSCSASEPKRDKWVKRQTKKWELTNHKSLTVEIMKGKVNFNFVW